MRTVAAEISLTPEQVAEAFWELASDEQAQFFAHLDRIAEGKLCLQMAGVVREIADLSAAGDYSAMNGFRTMLAHANDYHESATDIRVWGAQRAITRMAELAKEQM